jgi:hypothetical protein
MPPPAVTRSDRHLGFAKLATCRGDTFAASAHQGEALLAANAAQTEDAEQLFSNPERWLENQMRMASLLRHAARMESDQRRYRDALRTLHKATNRLNTLQGQLSFLGAAQAQALATTDVERERAAVEAMRQQVVAGMSQR